MQPRAIHYVSALLVGLGIGVIAYRFAILGFFWEGSTKWVFPALGSGLVAAGFALQSKDTQSERPAVTTRIACAIVGIGASMGLLYLIVPTLGRISLERRDIVGLSFELPTAKPDVEVIDYNTGTVTWKQVGGANAVITMSWQVGVITKEDLELAVKALATEVGSGSAPSYIQMAGPNGSKLDTMAVETNKDVPLRMTALPCGNRGVFVMSIGAKGVETIHERMLASFRCTPDAAKESVGPGVVRVALSMPGWYVNEKQPGQLTLTDGQGILIIRELAQNQDKLQDMVVPLLRAFGGTAETRAPKGDRVMFGGVIEGEHYEGWARRVACPTHGVLLLAMAGTAEGAEAVYLASTNAGCLRDGEKPPEFPDAPPEAPAPQ